MSLPILAGCLTTEHGQAREPFFSKYGIGIVHPLQEPAPPDTAVSAYGHVAYGHDAPKLAHAEHVYVFCINGGDPLCIGNFNGLSQFIKAQGCPNTFFGQLWHANQFYSQIKEIQASDRSARFVLVGYSFGANRVRALANDLQSDGIAVALLAYVAGDTIDNSDYSRPANARRILNIRTHGMILYGGNLVFKGEEIDGARNVFVEARHMLLPSRSMTLDCLLQEIADVTQRSD